MLQFPLDFISHLVIWVATSHPQGHCDSFVRHLKWSHIFSDKKSVSGSVLRLSKRISASWHGDDMGSIPVRCIRCRRCIFIWSANVLLFKFYRTSDLNSAKRDLNEILESLIILVILKWYVHLKRSIFWWLLCLVCLQRSWCVHSQSGQNPCKVASQTRERQCKATCHLQAPSSPAFSRLLQALTVTCNPCRLSFKHDCKNFDYK